MEAGVVRLESGLCIYPSCPLGREEAIKQSKRRSRSWFHLTEITATRYSATVFKWLSSCFSLSATTQEIAYDLFGLLLALPRALYWTFLTLQTKSRSKERNSF
ncbi:hypothetical protein Cob_v001783 [Colletotrichum orbiculare MAFF 240422]|uniref:Uncharacterized protein n=1 Tax=Colletotrichum orbiculare (strain 104-T / ATCC 96160 / CBS 514.97 / LARS 414 / MAFF 240422) TaxID=1213857 RepID=A0A484G7C4_COLOR|nr:hypothetical protein Cob_v001783 [Colletotrichum orbiculare MAFF 240422]